MPKQFTTKPAEPKTSYNPKDDELEALDHVKQRYYDMQDSTTYQRTVKTVQKAEKAWEALREDKNIDDWQSNYYIPLTTSVVESILSDMVDQRYRPIVLPRGSEDVSKARLMQKILDYAWDMADGDRMLQDVLRSALIRGTGFAQEYYLRDRRIIRDIVQLDKISKNRWKEKFIEKEVYEYDDVMAEEVSFWDLFVDENAREFNSGSYKARDVIRRYIMNYDDAKAFFHGPVWNPLNNFRFVRPGAGDTNYHFPSGYTGTSPFKPPQGSNQSNQVEVLWYWSREPVDALIVCINGVVIRSGPNIYKHKQLPFVKAIDIRRPSQFFGKGEPELLESIQEELNTLRRMSIDRHHLDIDKSFIMDPSATTISDEDLISRPHGMIPGDPDKIKPIEYGDIPMSVQLTFKAINEDAVRVTGVDDRFQAVSKTATTATEAAILKESTLKRIRMKLLNVEQGLLTDLGRMRISNILQFYSIPKLEKIVGESNDPAFQQQISQLASMNKLEVRNGVPYSRKFKEIRTENTRLYLDARGEVQEEKQPGVFFFELKPEMILPTSSNGYDLKVSASPTLPISKPLMQDKVREIVQAVIPFADGQTTKYNPEKLLDEMLRTLDFDPEQFKDSPEMGMDSVPEERLGMIVDLATQENEEVLNGGTIPENGTPYAPQQHTEAHIAFLRSEQMKNAPEEVYRKLVKHTMGEIIAIEARSGGASMIAPSQAGGLQTGSASNGEQLQSIIPNKIQGGNQVPTGQSLGNG